MTMMTINNIHFQSCTENEQSIMHVHIPSLLQIVAGRLDSAKPLSDLMLGYF